MSTEEKLGKRFSPMARWHMKLRADIMKQHPEVRELFGPYPMSFVFVLSFFLLHWGIAYMLRASPVLLIVGTAATIGMTLFHAQGSLLHDAAHRLVFSSEPLASVCDLFIELTFTSFAESLSYSMGHARRHHLYLGDYPYDNEIPDLCTHYTGVHLRAKTPTGEKILFGVRIVLAMVPLSFLLDPILVDFVCRFLAPHIATEDVRRQYEYPWKDQAKMYTFQTLSAATIGLGFYYLGWRSMLYHFLCLSFETNAFVSVWRTGQDAAEHNPDDDDRPTNSHYYWLYNLLFFNTGYHNEHHTFPTVAWVRLPALKKIAPTFFTSEIRTTYWRLYVDQVVSHFYSYRLSKAQESSMGKVCLKSSQKLFAKEAAEKSAQRAALARQVKRA